MKVTVILVQEFYTLTRKHRIVYDLPEGSTIRDLIDRLPEVIREKVIDENGDIRHPVEIAVNGRRIEFLNGLDTRLNDGDEVLVSPRALFVV